MFERKIFTIIFAETCAVMLGSEATPNQWPFMARMRYIGSRHNHGLPQGVCGASIISRS